MHSQPQGDPCVRHHPWVNPQVKELRDLLTRLGMDSTGGRYELLDRINSVKAVHTAAVKGDMDDLTSKVRGLGDVGGNGERAVQGLGGWRNGRSCTTCRGLFCIWILHGMQIQTTA
jgi:hypothetical protein